MAGVCFLAACSRQGNVTSFEQARLEFLQGDLVRAQLSSQQGYDRCSRKDVECQWRFRLLQAEILVNQGRADAALAMLQPALPSILANGDPAIKKLILQAIALARLSHPDEAIRDLGQAEQLAALNHSALGGELARAQGVVAITRSQVGNAGSFFRTSLQIARQQGDRYLELSGLLNLGVVAMMEEHHDEAIEWLNHAREEARTLKVRLTEEKALGNLGLELYYMGDFEQSLALSQQAAEQAQGLDAVYDEVQWLDQIGLLHYRNGQLREAEEYYNKSLALARKIQNNEKIVSALTTLSLLAAKEGKFDQAQQLDRDAMARAGENRSWEPSLKYILGMISAGRGDTSSAENLFESVVNNPQSDSSLRWEAAGAQAWIGEAHRRPAEADRAFRRALGLFERARASIQAEDTKLPFSANASELYDSYVNFLIGQKRTLEALQQADFSRAQTLAEGLGVLTKASGSVATLNAQQIAQRAKATLLFYWLGPQHSYLWAISTNQVRMFVLPPSSEIDRLVQDYDAALRGPHDPIQSANAAGVRLFDLLVKPAQGVLAPGAKVVVIPDGSLNRLNFETLIVSEPTMHYWIEDVTVSNASSLRLLAGAHRASTAAPSLLLMGDAVSPDVRYPSLSNAAAEMESIRTHFQSGNTRVFSGAQATPTAYLGSSPGNFSYIHFVAHGTASRLSPLDSAIVLSKATAEEDSFKLYARDIIRHPLQADLVTISTCFGAGARAYTGEGLVGLSWAFLRAGAHSVIGALWEVSDTSTPQLMDRMYSELRKGNSPEMALRSAKLSLLHSDGVFRKPFYWAPFQLYTGA